MPDPERCAAAPERCFRPVDFAADLVALLDHLGVSRAHWVGHSLGSIVAQQVAIARPERVDRLVLVGSAATTRGNAVARAFLLDGLLEGPWRARALDGEAVWSVDTTEAFGVRQNFFGVGSTPAVEGDLLLVNVGGSPPDSPGVQSGETKGAGSGIVAFDKRTGKVVYKITDELASYASMRTATIGGRRWGLMFARGGLVGFEPESGKVDFHFPWRAEDIESVNAASSSGVRGAVLAAAITEPSNWRASRDLDAWLKARQIVGLSGIDTRALTALIRDRGMPNAVIAHDPEGRFDIEALKAKAAALPSMDGQGLVPLVTSAQRFDWDETTWRRGEGYGHQEIAEMLQISEGTSKSQYNRAKTLLKAKLERESKYAKYGEAKI